MNLNWTIVQPSLEQELRLESDARAVLEDDNHEEVAKLCSVLLKQNWYQGQVIKQSIGRIEELEAIMATIDPPPGQTWQDWLGKRIYASRKPNKKT